MEDPRALERRDFQIAFEFSARRRGLRRSERRRCLVRL